MILTQVLEPECIKVPLESKDKESAIEELVNVLDAQGLVKKKDDVLKAVLMREKTRSTGIGSGIAIPHGKCKAAKELVMSMGVTKEEIDFDSVDGHGVRIIILLISPIDQTGPHIQALARISRLMLDKEFKHKLEEVKTAEEAYKLISEKED